MKDFLKKYYRVIISYLPKSRAVDKALAYANFIRAHKRLPTKQYFNDVLFKIKISDEILEPQRQFTSDKELVKIFVKSKVGDHLNVPTKAVLSTEEEINAYNFEDGDVIKPTHASGIVMFASKEPVDKGVISQWLKVNYYDLSREANYRYLKPKVIIEPSIFGRTDVDDIKFFCVNGTVKVIQWDFDRQSNHTRKLYDRNWKSLNASIGYPLSSKEAEKPIRLDDMIDAAEILSKSLTLVRIDMYYDYETKCFYIGEITHCHGNANEQFDSLESEIRISKQLFEH